MNTRLPHPRGYVALHYGPLPHQGTPIDREAVIAEDADYRMDTIGDCKLGTSGSAWKFWYHDGGNPVIRGDQTDGRAATAPVG